LNVQDTSSERKTAENFVTHLENAVKTVRIDYHAFLIAVVTDASGECRKARKDLAWKYPDIIFLDCYAHQVRTLGVHSVLELMASTRQINLVVGDYFKSDASVLEFTDQATDLITWLCSKTQVLALLREVQARLGKNTVKAVIRAVLTRWTAHYQSYSRLLDLHSVLVVVVDMDSCRPEKDRCVVAGDAKGKKKAKDMVKIIKDDAFWRVLPSPRHPESHNADRVL
jgi:hypothetical protein